MQFRMIHVRQLDLCTYKHITKIIVFNIWQQIIIDMLIKDVSNAFNRICCIVILHRQLH